MQLSGVILDQYDDLQGGVVRQRLRPSDVPTEWYTSKLASPEELLDEEFALILLQDGKAFRKYATASPADTSLSAFYFLRCGAKLPKEAQKIAAQNLRSSLLIHGYGVPEAIENLCDNPRPFQKIANAVDVSGISAPVEVRPLPRPTNPNMYALGGTKTAAARYPIDSFDRFLKAVEYFPKYADSFSLSERREYCTKVAARAHQLGQKIPDKMRVYAQVSEKLAEDNFQRGMYWRRELADRTVQNQRMLDGIEKAAKVFEPDIVLGLLHEFDKQAGLVEHWDLPNRVPNPVRTVYKTAACYVSDDLGGDDVIFEEAGQRLSSRKLIEMLRRTDVVPHLYKTFSTDLVNGLMQDPIAVFNSLPDPHKLILSRLATDNSDGRDTP